MSEQTRELLGLVDMLPETEQNLINEMIKRILLAWDPDFTKVTLEKRVRMKLAGEVFSHEDVWGNL